MGTCLGTFPLCKKEALALQPVLVRVVLPLKDQILSFWRCFSRSNLQPGEPGLPFSLLFRKAIAWAHRLDLRTLTPCCAIWAQVKRVIVTMKALPGSEP